jgi:threonine synthase
MAACALLQELVQRAPVYQLNSINPFRLEGQKTLAFELLEQLDWQPPDHIIVPGGNLGNSSAIGKALLEMLDLGLDLASAESCRSFRPKAPMPWCARCAKLAASVNQRAGRDSCHRDPHRQSCFVEKAVKCSSHRRRV